MDFDTYVDCIKGKLIAKIRYVEADRCTKLLGVIHTNICGPFTPLTMGDPNYFITFMDDHSRNGFIEFICEKSEYLEAFKAFKAKVEFQQGKKIKMVNSDTSGEYYGKYNETRHNLRLFAKSL